MPRSQSSRSAHAYRCGLAICTTWSVPRRDLRVTFSFSCEINKYECFLFLFRDLFQIIYCKFHIVSIQIIYLKKKKNDFLLFFNYKYSIHDTSCCSIEISHCLLIMLINNINNLFGHSRIYPRREYGEVISSKRTRKCERYNGGIRHTSTFDGERDKCKNIKNSGYYTWRKSILFTIGSDDRSSLQNIRRMRNYLF